MNGLKLLKKCKAVNPKFNISNSNDIDTKFDSYEQELLKGTFRNRDILVEALTELLKSEIDHGKIGSLLNEHHQILRDCLKISTPKIEKMIAASINAGAFGGKINGSGGGGCMFVYAPKNPERVAEAINNAGGKSYLIQSDLGTKIEK